MHPPSPFTHTQRLREGVLRDVERLERKRENQRALEEQIRLTRELVALREHQEVTEVAGNSPT